MRRTVVHARPEYVLNFEKPPHTEIKYVNGYWYLYECAKQEEQQLSEGSETKKVKKAGRILGSITPNGFKESRARVRATALLKQEKSDQKAIAAKGLEVSEIPQSSSSTSAVAQYKFASDTLEVGASAYFYERTLAVRLRLKKYFPSLWSVIYVLHLLRLIYEPKFKRLKTHYQYSILSEIFPNIDLSSCAIRKILIEIGKSRSSIRDFMKEDISKDGTYLLIDGHRLITASKNRELAELGYDSKKRYKPQINILYIFTLGKEYGVPSYYKQYMGSTPDVSAFTDLLTDCNINVKDVIAVTDKGFVFDEGFDLLVERGLNYIMPLKRNNQYIKGKIPQSPTCYEKGFVYSNRSIFFKEIVLENDEGFKIFLYCDSDLYTNEINSIMMTSEKKNREVELKKEMEEKRRKKQKGRLSDEELSSLIPKEIDDIFADKEAIGTITLKVRSDELNGEQAFCIWKTRQAIEQYFKTYDQTLDFDDSFMRDDTTEEGWLFLNHLSAMTAMSSIDEISRLDLSKNISLDDLRTKLRKIHADCIDGTWIVKPIKSEVQQMCDKLELDVKNLSVFSDVLPSHKTDAGLERSETFR